MQVLVLGKMALVQGGATITRFESRRVASLLAYLALSPRRAHPREELLELLWPEVDPEISRQRLRQALSSLRRQVEPPGVPYGTVLFADRSSIQMNPEVCTCDAVEFEKLVRERRYSEARELYAGELLPGFYDEWVLDERNRLEALFESLPENKEGAGPESVESVPTRPRVAQSPISIPSYLTEFLGREVERALLIERASSCRLITITGMGGAGKTRLSIEAGRELAASFDRIVFVSFADCVTPAQMPEQIRMSLQLPDSGIPAMDQVASALSGQSSLMILDNLEQLVGLGGEVPIQDMLQRLPGLTCIATSRRLIGISGEQELPLTPLAVPLEGSNLIETARNPSVALFINRAQAARPGFQLSEKNLADIIAVCRALEGMPLAIELAASRIRVLSVTEMRNQIQDRFRWLVRSGPGSDKEGRHRSLVATLEWSWRLLSPSQQKFISQISVFRGGFTAEAATWVCDLEDARERLESLIMDSLVQAREGFDGSTRFGMLEAVRDFARERLTSEDSVTTRGRHQTYYLDVVRKEGRSLSVLQNESDNILSAFESAIADANVDAAFALSAALESRWLAITGTTSVLSLIQQALALPGGTRHLRIEAMDLASNFALLAANIPLAQSLANEALASAGDVPADRALALLACNRIDLATLEPLAKVRPIAEEAVAMARLANDDRILGLALHQLARTSNRAGKLDRAEEELAESVRLLEASGDLDGMTRSMDNLANTQVIRGNLDEALDIYKRCQNRALEIGDLATYSKIFQNLATVYARQGRWEESDVAGRECIRRCREIGNSYILLHGLWNHAETMSYLGQFEEAAKIMSFTEKYWIEQYVSLAEGDDVYVESVRERVASALGEERTSALWLAGETLTLSEAIQMSLHE